LARKDAGAPHAGCVRSNDHEHYFSTRSLSFDWRSERARRAGRRRPGRCVEAEVWAEAREAMRSGEPALHHFSLTADEASEEGMVCGGTMDIFIDIWKTDHS